MKLYKLEQIQVFQYINYKYFMYNIFILYITNKSQAYINRSVDYYLYYIIGQIN